VVIPIRVLAEDAADAVNRSADFSLVAVSVFVVVTEFVFVIELVTSGACLVCTWVW